ncbi:MAG: hypothetical protein JNK23_08335 [Opitutaceae bacterium]|nr:hypothetical protein [Opitutaceae bacterium]
MTSTFFYHSFPRKKDHVLGLKILESLFRKGLLLTGEERTFAATRNLPAAKAFQQRACFTALSPNEVSGHAEDFGEFALEFDGKALRAFGALPAVYFAGRLPDGEFFNESGQMLARQLLEAHQVLGEIWDRSRNGTADERQMLQSILRRDHRANLPPEELYFCLQALCNLSYPTDDPKWTGPLEYYHQREWKIVPNLAFAGVWHYRTLEDVEKEELIASNREFFEKPMGGKRQIDFCSYFHDVGGKNIIDFARRVIAPEPVLEKAREIVHTRKATLDVVSASGAEFRAP